MGLFCIKTAAAIPGSAVGAMSTLLGIVGKRAQNCDSVFCSSYNMRKIDTSDTYRGFKNIIDVIAFCLVCSLFAILKKESTYSLEKWFTLFHQGIVR